MIGALTGTVFSSTSDSVIIMVAGVGYAVSVPQTVAQQRKPNENITLLVHTRVEDESITLYGFLTRNDLTLFELLLSVSGVGPKTALAIVNRGEASVRKAVVESDVDFFTTIPRVGRKNAQKIIIELKSKLGSVRELDLSRELSGETKQILNALLSMGFRREEAIGAIRKLDDTDRTLAEKIRRALQIMGK
jgi:Holliday junction DNA helicase RuvA